jgi:hypothetical protein
MLKNHQALLHDYNGARASGLPNKSLTALALSAFFRCLPGTLYSINTPEAAGQLLHHVYHGNDAAEVDSGELFALAAIGSLYDADQIPEEARAEFFRRASMSLSEVVSADPLRGIRILISQCLICMVKKSTEAVTVIGENFASRR